MVHGCSWAFHGLFFARKSGDGSLGTSSCESIQRCSAEIEVTGLHHFAIMETIQRTQNTLFCAVFWPPRARKSPGAKRWVQYCIVLHCCMAGLVIGATSLKPQCHSYLRMAVQSSIDNMHEMWTDVARARTAACSAMETRQTSYSGRPSRTKWSFDKFPEKEKPSHKLFICSSSIS